MEGVIIKETDGGVESRDALLAPVVDRNTAEGARARKVLIVEPDIESVQPLAERLARTGIEVTLIDRGEMALTVLERERPHLVMLDWDLPAVITMGLLRHARRHDNEDSPRLIALSSFASEQHVVSGLELGVDDYVVKPFSIAEVAARVRALLRPIGSGAIEIDYLEFGQLRMSSSDARITVRGNIVALRSTEFRLLEFFIRHPERAFPRETLLTRVWGRDCGVDARAVDVTIQRIRRTLEPHGCEGYVQTVRGLGYRLSRSNVTAL